MLSHEASARLCSHIARLNDRLPRIVDDAAAALTPAFPGVRACVPTRTRQGLYETMSAVAYVAKHLTNLRAVDAWLEAMGAHARALGFNAAAARQALAFAIVDAVRRNARMDWSPQLEQDWRTLAELVCASLAIGAQRSNAEAHSTPVRRAA